MFFGIQHLHFSPCTSLSEEFSVMTCVSALPVAVVTFLSILLLDSTGELPVNSIIT